ncbi:hypothetical protein [Rhodoferax sp. PAMC 29310]|uniref:hypothetical protein n=1 Tax=Rhodoferax sp. PAMC 29310 TaxID=2822760 RepID=UPI001B32606D|nr:hypothetical protein [Rhodoferax sp. PAMC 29310]
MTTSANKTTNGKAKPTAKPVAKKSITPSPVATTMVAKKGEAIVSSEPSLRFYHSKELRAKTNAVLDAIEAAPDLATHGESMADLVNELIDAGMDYYFLRALKKAQMGFVSEQSARLGMSGAVKLLSSVSRKFIVRMDKDQLLVVASHIRELS